MSNNTHPSHSIANSSSNPSLRFACVDTSTFTESIALVDGNQLRGERLIRRPRGHASGLHSDLDALLKELEWTLDDLDGFVCGLGPGSFTGMRVGLAAFKGLAYALQRPLYGVPTPFALLEAASCSKALSLIDARRGEIYAQGFGLDTPQCLTPQALIDLFQETQTVPELLIGEGALAYSDLFKRHWPEVRIPQSTAFHVPRASFLVPHVPLHQPCDLHTLEPIYVRRSDAEINYPDGFPSEERLFKTL